MTEKEFMLIYCNYCGSIQCYGVGSPYKGGCPHYVKYLKDKEEGEKK